MDEEVKNRPGRKAGYAVSDETKQKISEAQLNRDPAYKAQIAAKRRATWAAKKAAGFKVSDETKQRMSAAKKGRAFTEAHKAALRAAKQRKREEKLRESTAPQLP